MESLREKYCQNGYEFFILPTEDIRDKNEHKQDAKTGITNEKGNIKPEYEEIAMTLINQINEYFQTIC